MQADPLDSLDRGFQRELAERIGGDADLQPFEGVLLRGKGSAGIGMESGQRRQNRRGRSALLDEVSSGDKT